MQGRPKVSCSPRRKLDLQPIAATVSLIICLVAQNSWLPCDSTHIIYCVHVSRNNRLSCHFVKYSLHSTVLYSYFLTISSKFYHRRWLFSRSSGSNWPWLACKNCSAALVHTSTCDLFAYWHHSAQKLRGWSKVHPITGHQGPRGGVDV
jgi:hypothetical protein